MEPPTKKCTCNGGWDGNRHNDTCACYTASPDAMEGDWATALQFEVLEDYLYCADHRHYRKEPNGPEYLEEMRGHFEKLKSFIRTRFISKDEAAKKIAALKYTLDPKIFPYPKHEDSYTEADGWNAACDRMLADLGLNEPTNPTTN